MSGSTVASLLALIALPAVAFAADPRSQKGPNGAPLFCQDSFVEQTVGGRDAEVMGHIRDMRY